MGDAAADAPDKFIDGLVDFDKYIIFPKFATYWRKLLIFTIVFGAIMVAIIRISVAPAPITPNFRILYDIIFGSHTDAEAKLGAHIRTAISLGHKNDTETKVGEGFVSGNILDDVSKNNVWISAAQRWQSIGKEWFNRAIATLFITGHTVRVYSS
jgi:hypothetical protein